METRLHNHAEHTKHHGHRFDDIERLRSPERLAHLEVDRVVDFALEGAAVDTVLDIGTGSGIFAEAFHHHGKEVTGVDVNPEMVKGAQHYVPAGIFQPAAAEDLPFSDSSFDLTFMGLVLHETDDMVKAIQEAFRVTRNRLVILEWPYHEQDIGPGLEERLRTDQVLDLASRAGFGVGEVYALKSLVLYRFDKRTQHAAL